MVLLWADSYDTGQAGKLRLRVAALQHKFPFYSRRNLLLAKSKKKFLARGRIGRTFTSARPPALPNCTSSRQKWSPTAKFLRERSALGPMVACLLGTWARLHPIKGEIWTYDLPLRPYKRPFFAKTSNQIIPKVRAPAVCPLFPVDATKAPTFNSEPLHSNCRIRLILGQMSSGPRINFQSRHDWCSRLTFALYSPKLGEN